MIAPRTIPGPDAVADHYNELDPWYRAIWGEHVHHGLFEGRGDSIAEATERLIVRLAEALDIQPGETCCDVGCGYGGTARYLAVKFNTHVTGVTLSQAQAGFAQTLDVPNVDIRVGDFLDSALEPDAFDAAYSVESSEHFADKLALFREMRRILKPDGRVAIAAWLARENPGAFQTRHLLEPICREGRLPGMGTRSEYESMLADAGFTDIAYTDLSRQVPRTWTLVIRRIVARLFTDPEARAFLRSRPRNLEFGLSLFRIRAAYALGAMQYGLFTARKPEQPV